MAANRPGTSGVRLALAGDVMIGRGIDQVLAHPSDPVLHEPWVQDARAYVDLAVQRSGSIPMPVDDSYIWGAALDTIDARRPDARIVNLETSITVSNDHWPEKGIHYRMHPDNIGCLHAAEIDCCVLANNHVMDWGRAGLEETLAALSAADLRYTGAGRDEEEAARPAVIVSESGDRVLVFGYCDGTCGVPAAWRAGPGRSGVNLLPDLTEATAHRIARHMRRYRRERDIVVLSIHWGGNWGYALAPEHIAFAHALVDLGVAHVIHGHSSHHPKGIELYHGRPILYGCGDLLNDYEGISGHETFRSNLCIIYFIDIDPRNGETLGIQMAPMRMQRFRLNEASAEETAWLATRLARESPTVRIEAPTGKVLLARW